MKTFITSHLLKFGFVAMVLTLLFRIGLSTSISKAYIIGIILSAVFYAVFMALNGAYFGKKDYENLPIYDVGFRFHLMTFTVHFFVTFLWFVFNFQSIYEHISTIYFYGIIWLSLLIAHGIYYLYTKKLAIKGLDGEDLFE